MTLKRWAIPAAGALLAIALPTPAPAKQASEIVRETHGDWTIRCAADAPEDCFMVSTGFDIDGSPVAELSLVKFLPGHPAVAGATVIVPLGTALPEGVVLQVDNGSRVRFGYDFCAPAGCIANLALTPDLVAAMQAGSRARVMVIPAGRPDTPKTIGVSLSGFTAAYRALAPERP